MIECIIGALAVCVVLYLVGLVARKGKPAVVNRSTRLVGAELFKAQLPLIRSCHIRGRLRGGKTKLAIVLGFELVKMGAVKGCIANIPTKLPLPPEWWFLFDALVIFDESWTELDNRNSLHNPRSWSAFAGKSRTIYLYPSVIALDKRQSYLWCEPVSRTVVPGLRELVRWLRQVPVVSHILAVTPLDYYGDEVINFKWGLEMGYRTDGGKFKMVYHDAINDQYASFWTPGDDADITDAWNLTFAHYMADQERLLLEGEISDIEYDWPEWIEREDPLVAAAATKLRSLAGGLPKASGRAQQEGRGAVRYAD